MTGVDIVIVLLAVPTAVVAILQLADRFYKR
jgi:hypothetical protein